MRLINTTPLSSTLLRDLPARLRLLALPPLMAACVIPIDRSSESERIPLDGDITHVLFDLEAGDIEIRRGDVAEVERIWWGTRPEMHLDVSDGVLELETECRNWCRVEHIVHLPGIPSVSGSTGSGDIVVLGARSLDVVAGSGDIHAVRVDGHTFVETGSGDVDVAHIGGELRISTGSGNVRADEVHSERAHVETGSGDVRLSAADIADRLDVLTGSGDVTLELLRGSYDLRTLTGSGQVSVRGVTVDRDAGSRVRAETGSGDIAVKGR